MAGTGRIGKRITELLLASGEKVRALGRSESKISQLEKVGAETRAGEATDSTFLAKAFRGADAVYTLLPYDLVEPRYYEQQSKVGEAVIKAVRESGVRYLVFLSSIGADQPSGTGMLVSMHVQEERLRRLEDVNVLILRPGPFFENLLGLLELIKYQG